MRVNLAREESVGSVLNKNHVIVIGLIIILIASGLIYYNILTKRTASLEIKNKEAENRLMSLRKKRVEYLNLQKKVDNLSVQLKKNDQNKKIPGLTEQNWNITLIELGKIIPEKVMISSLNITKERLSIKGMGASSILISQFIDNLAGSDIIKNVNLEQLTNGKEVNYTINAEIVLREGEN